MRNKPCEACGRSNRQNAPQCVFCGHPFAFGALYASMRVVAALALWGGCITLFLISITSA